MEELNEGIYLTDALEGLQRLPDKSVDLVLTDPPYNIGKADWDRIEKYTDWCISWLNECSRVLKPTGVLYLWHNDLAQIAELLHAINLRTPLAFRSFCIWDKGDTYRAQSWKNRDPKGDTAPRSWFNVCEYVLHFFNAPEDADASWKYTGLDRINSNPECYRPIKDWYSAELDRLGITKKDIAAKYTEVTGRKPYMLRHYFQDSQFELPTQKVWDTVYRPLGFSRTYEDLQREHQELREQYEGLREGYEGLRNVHICDAMHCNVWHRPPLPSNNRLHSCQKPVDLLERMIRVSTRGEGAVVLDPFAGSGSTAEACLRTGRKYICFENDPKTHAVAVDRLQRLRQESAV